MRKQKKTPITLATRRQTAAINHLCRVCARFKPDKGKEICKECTAKRANFKRKKK